MTTARWSVVDPVRCEPVDLEAAARWIRAGGIVIVPTDTFYGLAADPRLARAVADIFALKGRASGEALPLVAGSTGQVIDRIGPLDPAGARLAGTFWPGPLSLLVATPEAVAPGVDGGTGAVAVRVPAHPVARALADAVGHPVTATSANRSGEPPVREVGGIGWMSADPRVWTIDAGRSPGGAASTIVDTRVMPPRLVREGAVGWDRVLEFLHS